VRLDPLSVEERDLPNAATWRGALEDEAGEVQGFQFADPPLCEAVYRVGVVHSGVDRDEARRIEIADQAHGLARSPQPDFHFRAHRHPLHVPAQGLDQHTVAFVPPVVPDVVAEQTLADPDADRYGHVRQRAAAALGVSSAGGAERVTSVGGPPQKRARVIGAATGRWKAGETGGRTRSPAGPPFDTLPTTP